MLPDLTTVFINAILKTITSASFSRDLPKLKDIYFDYSSHTWLNMGFSSKYGLFLHLLYSSSASSLIIRNRKSFFLISLFVLPSLWFSDCFSILFLWHVLVSDSCPKGNFFISTIEILPYYNLLIYFLFRLCDTKLSID